jgi:group I intron endonuclease
MIGIYKITSPTNKIYIGQSVDIKRRKTEYTNYCHSGKLQNSIKKHGFENHTFEILEECSIELLNETERFWQDFYDVLGPNGLNSVLTKTSDKKMIHSEETKQKLRDVNLGKKHSDETKEKCSVASLGYKHTEEAKSKISKARKGSVYTDEQLEHKRKFIYTDEWRNNISKAKKGKKYKQGLNTKKVINTETGEIFESIKQAALSIDMSVETLGNRLRGVTRNKTNLIFYKE